MLFAASGADVLHICGGAVEVEGLSGAVREHELRCGQRPRDERWCDHIAVGHLNVIKTINHRIPPLFRGRQGVGLVTVYSDGEGA